MIFNFVIFVATKKGKTRNFFLPSSFVAVFGSGMDNNLDPGSVINIQDPQPEYNHIFIHPSPFAEACLFLSSSHLRS
jgi:hypothetical protein